MSKLEEKEEMIQRINFVTLTHESIKQEISRADTKANISITVLSLLLTIGVSITLLSSLYEKIVSSTKYQFLIAFYILLGLYCFSTLAGIFTSISVYRARLNHPKKDGEDHYNFMFFRGINKIRTSEEYLANLSILSIEQILEQIAYQVHALAQITTKKMKRVNMTVYILLSTIILVFVLLIMSILILLRF